MYIYQNELIERAGGLTIGALNMWLCNVCIC